MSWARTSRVLTLAGTGDIAGTGNGLDNFIDGNSNNDTIDGAAGNDQMWGSFGNDLLQGGVGNDTMDGFFDDDLLMGGAGSDLLNLAENLDTLVGGAGKDSFNFQFADANRDTIADFNGNPGGDCWISAPNCPATSLAFRIRRTLSRRSWSAAARRSISMSTVPRAASPTR